MTQFEVREARRQAVPTALDHEAPPTPFFQTITYRGTARDTWAWHVNRQSIGSSSVRLVVVAVVVVVGTWRRRHFVGRRRHFGALGGGGDGGAKAKVEGLPRPPPPFAL